MTLVEFNSLNLKDQMETAWEKGIIDDHLLHKDFEYILYRVYDFYVEMAFHRVSEEFVQITGFY